MKEQSIALTTRTGTGKGVGRKLRMSGKIPAVIYGLQQDPRDVCVDIHAFNIILQHDHSENPLLKINIDGGAQEDVIVRALQRHPVNGRLVHADFQRVNLLEKMKFKVHVRPTGAAVGVRDGGIFETINQTIDIFCLPTAVPAEIVVDVAHMKIGDILTAGQVPAPEGVEILEAAHIPVFVVHTPKVEAEATALPGDAVAEPEVITEKKKEKGAEE